MKERPILFSTEMVQAIIDGRKTQTRRTKGLEKVNNRPDDWAKPAFDPSTKQWVFTAEHGIPDQVRNRCPYGEVGDVLWVRESMWWCYDNNDILRPVADGPAPTTDRRHYKKISSIHMPYAACRLKLEITGIRVERLQDISEYDAKNEGVPNRLMPMTTCSDGSFYSYGFNCLWNEINGVVSWKQNPFVWVIEFKRV